MKKWELVCSKEAIDIDYETIIESEDEPDFWTCYEIAMDHDCGFWTISELEETNVSA